MAPTLTADLARLAHDRTSWRLRGVGNFQSRIIQHREGVGGFTRRYGLKRLVWYEAHHQMTDAIQRQTSIKRWPRQWKINLTERDNPRWDDLYGAVFNWTPAPRQV